MPLITINVGGGIDICLLYIVVLESPYAARTIGVMTQRLMIVGDDPTYTPIGFEIYSAQQIHSTLA